MVNPCTTCMTVQNKTQRKSNAELSSSGAAQRASWLGVGPNVAGNRRVPAVFPCFALSGGVNEERLQLCFQVPRGPHQPCCRNDGGAGGMGDVTHLAKASKAWRRTRHKNSGQGQGGALRGLRGTPRPRSRTRENDQFARKPGSVEIHSSTEPQQAMSTSHNGALHDKKLPHLWKQQSNIRPGRNGQRMNVRDDPVECCRCIDE
jgi:hypothetical protein